MYRTPATLALVACLALLLPAPAARALEPGPGAPPVPGRVARGFDPPAERWGAGHRGVDLVAAPGSHVRTPASGRVAFVGTVAGRPVVVVTHGEVRTTLEPVTGTVPVGRTVEVGDVIGVLEAGHACGAATCLHWGLRRGDAYLDPLSILAVGVVRLLPADAAGQVRDRALARALVQAAATVAGGSGTLARPVAGRLTSGFGRRLHPIFHEWRLHAGVDLSARCGTPIRAAADGVVRRVGYDDSGGWRLILDHPGASTTALATTYLHAQGYAVRGGQAVRRGAVVGWVGSTGWSTGCHLHFGVTVNGQPTDPERWW